MIDSISSVYIYRTNRKSWKNAGIYNLYNLSYQVSGHYDHKFGGETLAVKKDTLFLIPPKSAYSVQCAEQGEAICVTFAGELEFSPTVYDCTDNPEIKSLFQKLLKYKNLEVKSNYCQAMSIVYKLLSFMYQNNGTEYIASDTRSKIEKARNYINENYTDAYFNIADISKEYGVSPKYFRSVFKKAYGKTPSQYVISLRLQRAVTLLRESNLSISDVADLSGFSDVYYFSKLFKARFDSSPTEYRKNQQEEK